MRHGSLFSGIGGFDLAAEWMGWENVFHCEWNEFGKKVLKHYWPNSISYDDITKTDFTIHRGTIDILTGGFPCQPYSVAGKRKGKDDDRHLWPEMLRAIREIQPGWVVGENVGGIVSWNGGMVFDEVQADLEAEGYKVLPFLLPACAVNAPHRRDRVWFIAYSYSFRNNSAGGTEAGIREQQNKEQSGNRGAMQINGLSNEQITANPDNINGGCGTGRQDWQEINNSGEGWIVADACNQGLQGCEKYGGVTGIRQNRNKQFAGCVPPAWENFPTEPPLCSRNDGLSERLAGITLSKHRKESLKGYGNAIVPQVALQIFKAIHQYKNL